MIETNLMRSSESMPTNTNPHEEMLDNHFKNIFMRLSKIDYALDYLYNEINKRKEGTR